MAVPSVPIPFQRRRTTVVVVVVTVRGIGATAMEGGVLAGLIGKNSVFGLNRVAPAPTQNETEVGFG